MTRVLCLEGITGAGKTVQAQKICNLLSIRDYSYVSVNEKQYEPFKRKIIEWHNSGTNQNFTHEMVVDIARARAETHRTHFIPLIGKIDYLIFDRSLYTSGVYQSNKNLTTLEIIRINLEEGAIRPEEGVIILSTPQVSRKRVDERRLKNNLYGLPSIHETIEEITKRRMLYLELAKQHPELYLIDSTNKKEDEVFEEIKSKLKL